MKLPDCPFYLMGMGNRRKIMYKNGILFDVLTREVIQSWNIISEKIIPSEYTVKLVTEKNNSVTIFEDENGVYINESDIKTTLTESKLSLPRFEEYENAGILRILHHEILINILDGKPVPNLFVYKKPWYRDSAMMCMCLEKTENLCLVKNWILGLREPFDKNNAGISEPDNLGEALFMISLVADASHPLVELILESVKSFEKDNYIVGLSDFAEHPVYQTKWLKLGLSRLGLEDKYEIPAIYDEYDSLFWMGYKDVHVEGKHFDQKTAELYPYLAWAEAHFYDWPFPMSLPSLDQYPITWEAEASQADYEGIILASNEYSEGKIAAPHTWHAAEMFLYLIKKNL